MKGRKTEGEKEEGEKGGRGKEGRVKIRKGREVFRRETRYKGERMKRALLDR